MLPISQSSELEVEAQQRDRDARAGVAVGAALNTATTFSSQPTQPLPFRATRATAADFDGDGKVDVAIAGETLDAKLAILRGSGSGSFAPAATSDAGRNPARAVESADFNGDGKPDLALLLAAPFMSAQYQLRLMFAAPSGAFTTSEDFPSFSSQEAVAMGDLDRDGKLDVVTSVRDRHLVYLNICTP